MGDLKIPALQRARKTGCSVSLGETKMMFFLTICLWSATATSNQQYPEDWVKCDLKQISVMMPSWDGIELTLPDEKHRKGHWGMVFSSHDADDVHYALYYSIYKHKISPQLKKKLMFGLACNKPSNTGKGYSICKIEEEGKLKIFRIYFIRQWWVMLEVSRPLNLKAPDLTDTFFNSLRLKIPR